MGVATSHPLGPVLREGLSRNSTFSLREAYDALEVSRGGSEETARFQAAFQEAIQDMQSLVNQGVLNETDLAGVGELTLAALKATNFLEVCESLTMVALFAGAISERCGPDSEVLRTDEHAQTIFKLVMRVLDENPPVDHMLDALCPPLMAFFNQKIPLLKQLRSEVSKDLEKTEILPLGMAREFLLMCIDDPILIGLVKVKDGVVTLEYARCWRFTGLTSNAQLAEFIGTIAEFECLGSKLDMDCWTAVRAGELPNSMKTAHRIWREGIPTDIPALDGIRIVLCFRGTISRGVAGFCTFPSVRMMAQGDGEPLSKDTRDALIRRIRTTSADEYVTGLGMQLKKGGNDEELQKLIRDHTLN